MPRTTRRDFLKSGLAATFVAGTGASIPAWAAKRSATEWVTLGGGPARAMIYRSYALDVPNSRITRALVMVHGTGRNADHYFLTAMSAAFPAWCCL